MKCPDCDRTLDPSREKSAPCADCGSPDRYESILDESDTCHFIGGPSHEKFLTFGKNIREVLMYEQPRLNPVPALGQLGTLPKPSYHVYTRGRDGHFYWTGPA